MGKEEIKLAVDICGKVSKKFIREKVIGSKKKRNGR